jgi:hypothetical protein
VRLAELANRPRPQLNDVRMALERTGLLAGLDDTILYEMESTSLEPKVEQEGEEQAMLVKQEDTDETLEEVEGKQAAPSLRSRPHTIDVWLAEAQKQVSQSGK